MPGYGNAYIYPCLHLAINTAIFRQKFLYLDKFPDMEVMSNTRWAFQGNTHDV